MHLKRWCSQLVCSVSFALAAIFVSPSLAVAQDGWTWQNPLPQGNSLWGVWGASSTDVYAVGGVGSILHYDGTSWHKMNSGTNRQLRAVWGTSSTSIYAVGSYGVILHFDGVTWSTMNSGVNDTLMGVWGSSDTNVFVAGLNVGILHYDGSNWINVSNPDIHGLAAIWGSGSSDIFAVGPHGNIVHYDGTSWTTMASGSEQNLGGVWGSGAGDVFAVGDGGIPLHYDGTSWSPMTLPTSSRLSGVWGRSAGDVYAVGYPGVIFHFDGSSWSTAATSYPRLITGIWGIGSSDVFTVDIAGTILHFNGTDWQQSTGGVTAADLFGIWGAGPDNVFAVGRSGTILHYSGDSWHEMASGVTQNLFGVWGTSESNAFAVGSGGTILHYDGAGWTPMVSGTASALLGVWGSSASDVFAVGDDEVILHFDGTEWTTMHTGTSSYFEAIWGTSGTDVYAVGGESGIIFHYDGTQWSYFQNRAYHHLTGVWGTSSDDIYVVGYGPTLLHYSIESGWSDFTHLVPTYYEDLMTIWGDPTGRIYVAAADGTIFYRPAPGEGCNNCIWKTMETNADTFFYGLWGASKLDVFAVGAGGAIMHYSGSPANQSLQVVKDGSGSGTVTSSPPGIDCGLTCSAALTAGQQVTLTAEPDPGMLFAGWNGPCTGSGACIVTMDTAKVVTATFTQPTFLLSVMLSGIGSGTVTSSPPGIDCGAKCSASFPAGQPVTLTAIQGAGMSFTGWSGACTGTGVCTVAMDSAKAITAAFTIQGAVIPEAGMMYYGPRLGIGERATTVDSVVALASTSPKVIWSGAMVMELVIFTSTVPANVHYLSSVDGSEPYQNSTATNRLINRLLLTGCDGGPCGSVRCSYYSPDGTHSEDVITSPRSVEFLYMPFARRP